MKPTIVFLDRYSISKSDVSSLVALGNYTEYDNTPKDQIIERCANADVIIANKTPLKAETLKALPKLKLICIAATGMNNVDIEAARQLGIEVRNAVGYSTYSVAESTLCGVLSLMKQIGYYDNFVKSGCYQSSDYLFDFGRSCAELHNKRWGIIGLGNIGRQVAKLADAFGCEVCYYSTSGVERKEQYKSVSLEELLSRSDVLSVHSPLSDRTKNLIDHAELELMKHNALIVNVARGGIINEKALADALNRGKIAGAYVDVYSREPIAADNPLLSIDDPFKIIMTPHSSWATTEALQVLVETVAQNIKDFYAK